MKESTKKGYIAGVVFTIIALVLLVVTFDGGLTSSDKIIGIFTLVFGVLGVGSFVSPDIIGQIAAQMLKNYSDNQKRSSSRRRTSTKQVINNYGTMANSVGSGSRSYANNHSYNKSTKRRKKK